MRRIGNGKLWILLACTLLLGAASSEGQTPPFSITGVANQGTTSSATQVYWYTTVNADGQVEYGTSTSYGSLSAVSSTLATFRVIQLTGLVPASVYHYRVRSQDASGNLVVSGDYSFTTLPAAYDFALSKWGPQNVSQGSPMYVVLASTLKGGSSSNVTLSINKPAALGLTLSGAYTDASGNPYGYSSNWNIVLQFDTTSTPIGAHTVRITGSAGGVQKTIDVPVRVNARPVAPPKPSAYPALPSLPQLARWESQMIQYGRRHCNQATIMAGSTWEGGVWYYDGERTFYQIGDYTKDSSWTACAGYVEAMYRDTYVLPNDGRVSGWRNFSRGMAMDYLKTGDALSRDGVRKLSLNGVFAAPSTYIPYTVSYGTSREIAYALNSYMDAEDVGEPRHPLRDKYIDIALGHVDQWFGARTTNYIQPFMVGLTSEALIRQFEKTGDPRVLPMLTMAAEWLWANAWRPASQAFWYESYPFGGTDPGFYPANGAPDLNMLIVPIYGWLYQQTGDKKWIDRGDQAFAGGVVGAYLDGGKQFSQNYRLSFDYLKYRAAGTTGCNPAYGDLNQDSRVDVTDLVILSNYLAGNLTQGSPPFTAGASFADLDGSGGVNSVDAVILQNHLAGNISCLPK